MGAGCRAAGSKRQQAAANNRKQRQAGLRPTGLAARLLRHAFPFRRILAGANMFNEMPSKGRGRRALSAG